MVWLNIIRLKSGNPEVRRKAVESLDPAGDKRSRELLLAALRDEHETVRCAAVKALAQINDDESLNALITALHDPGGEVRQAAAMVLGQNGDSRAYQFLAATLKDWSPAVRMAAAGALRSLGWKPSSSEEQALYDVATGHTRAAAFAGQAAVRALLTELKHDTDFNRRAAAEALEDLADPEGATAPLLAALDDEESTVRVSAIHALSRDSSPEVTLKLLTLLRDADSR